MNTNKEAIIEIQQLLKNEYSARRAKNPSYSLRAFARQLNIDHAHIYRIMKGEKSPSKTTLIKLASLLNVDLMRIESTTPQFFKSTKKKTNWKRLQENEFSILSHWYHMAILDLPMLPNFRSDSKWVAKKLNITTAEAQFAIERLVDAGLVTIDGQKNWTVCNRNVSWTNHKATNEIRKHHQQQLLEQAKIAIRSIDFEYRQNSSRSLAIDVRLLPEVKKRIEEFKESIQELADKNKNYNEVYQLVVSFFPLTQVKNIRSSK